MRMTILGWRQHKEGSKRNSKKPLMTFLNPPWTESMVLDNKWPITEVRGHQVFFKGQKVKSLRCEDYKVFVVFVTGDRNKVQCCKEQYCIGTWNVRSMNQGKLEVVKQEMARMNVDILGISKLKWTGMGEFNSDDHYIYYCGQESLRRNGVAIIVNKRVWNAVPRCNLKNNRMISVSKANHLISW